MPKSVNQIADDSDARDVVRQRDVPEPAVVLLGRQHERRAAVLAGELVRLGGPGNQIGGVVGDAFDPPGVEHPGLDQPHLLDPEILGQPDRAGDVDDILGIDEDEDGGRAVDHASPRNETSCFFPFRAAAKPVFSTAFM